MTQLPSILSLLPLSHYQNLLAHWDVEASYLERKGKKAMWPIANDISPLLLSYKILREETL